MATIELGPLTEHFEPSEVAAIAAALRAADHGTLELSDDAQAAVLERNLDDDLLADFRDQLEANDAACDIYLPLDFEDPVDAAGYVVGSAQALLMVLDEIKDDLFAEVSDDEDTETADYDDDDERLADDDEDEDDPMELKDERLRGLWKLLHQGATQSLRDNLALIVRS